MTEQEHALEQAKDADRATLDAVISEIERLVIE
jgi:hypothetical protein